VRGKWGKKKKKKDKTGSIQNLPFSGNFLFWRFPFVEFFFYPIIEVLFKKKKKTFPGEILMESHLD